MKFRVTVIVGVLVAAALGVPVAAWCALLAVLAFAFGGLASILNADERSRVLMTWGLGFAFAALAINALGGGLRAALDTPAVQRAGTTGAVLVGALVGVVGIVAVLVRLVGAGALRAKPQKLPVRERAEIIARPLAAPVTPRPAMPPAPERPTPGATMPSARDELGIFRRKPQ